MKYKFTEKTLEKLKQMEFEERPVMMSVSGEALGEGHLSKAPAWFTVITQEDGFEEVAAPLKKGDKVRFTNKGFKHWYFGWFEYSNEVFEVGVKSTAKYEIIERYEWTEEDLKPNELKEF